MTRNDIWKIALTTVLLVVVAALGVTAGIAGWIWVQNRARPEPIDLAGQLRHVNKQVLIEYHAAAVVTHTDAPQGWAQVLSRLGIQQEFVILLRGTVPAGFNLESMQDEDVWVSADGTQVRLVLPPPVIFESNVSLDLERSQILAQRDRCPNLLCEDDLSSYQQNVLPQGQQLLIEEALRDGILEQAARDGIRYYEQFLTALGFEQVEVVVAGYGF